MAASRPADVCWAATDRAASASTTTLKPDFLTRQKKSKSSSPKNQFGSGNTPASATRRDTRVAPQQATSTGARSPSWLPEGTTLTVWPPLPTKLRP
jgi:hypothetical protein